MLLPPAGASPVSGASEKPMILLEFSRDEDVEEIEN
jgi:hypothetical protein